MNRFFSKLDLRDIKIDPNSSRFPPDAEEGPESTAAEDHDPRASADSAPAAESDLSGTGLGPSASPSPGQAAYTRPGYVPSWAPQPDRTPFSPATHDGVLSGNETSTGSASVDPNDALDTDPPVVQAEEIAAEVAFEETHHTEFAGYGVTAATDVEVAVESTTYGNGHANGHVEVLKVSARSRPSAVAGAIAGVVRESGRAEVQAIGAGATNQAVKAVAIARDYLRETGIEAVCLPAFIDVTIENEDRTAIRLVVEPR